MSPTRAGIATAYFTQGCVFLSLTTRLPKFESHWGVGQLGLTILMLMVVLLAGAGSLLAERLAPRQGSAILLRLGLLGLAVSLLISGTAGSAAMLGVGMAVYGLGLGVVDATCNMQAVALEHQVGRTVLPSFHGAWTAGGIAGTVLSLAFADASIGAVSIPLALLPLLAALGPLVLGGKGAASIGEHALQDISWRPIVLVGAACAIFYTVDTATTTWGAVYFEHTLAAPSGLVALATLPYLVASLVARVAGDGLTDRFGPALLLRIGAVVAVAGLVIVVVAPGWQVGVVGFLVMGAGIAVVAPLSYAAAGAIARASGPTTAASERARVDAVIARFNQFNYLGALLGAVLTGVIGTGSLRLGYALPAVLVLALIPLAAAFRPRVLATTA